MPAFSIRVLTKKIQSFGELNLPEILKDMIKYENGLVLVTGATGSGKSTIAKIVAAKYGLTYLDTGAMYRMIALYALENNINLEDEKV